MQKYCIKCGHELQDGAQFCSTCGSALSLEVSTSVEDATPAQADEEHPKRPGHMKRIIKWIALLLISAFVLLVALIVVMILLSRVLGEEEKKMASPVHSSQQFSKVAIISEDAKRTAIASIVGYPDVLDAAITQRDEDVSLVVIVAHGTNESRAKELGDNFVRMMKSFGPDQRPGTEIGSGVFDYQIGVYYSDETAVARGWKLSSSSRISW